MKVLMAIDDSAFSGNVTRAVVTQFRPENTEVLVLHVLQPIASLAPPEMAQGYAPEMEDQAKPARALVERIANELRRTGFTAHADVQIGDVTGSILDTAADWHADLIAVGSHGHKGIQNVLLGSVAESVARQAKCSIEIVRKPLSD
jgi:nucleotide-binding universal stress UspA family protein